MTLLAQMLIQGGVGFAIGAGTNELAIRWVFSALFTKKKKLIAANTKRLIRTELMTPEKIAAKICSSDVRSVVERNVRMQLDAYGDKARAICSKFYGRFEQRLPGLIREEVCALAEVADLFDDDLRRTIAQTSANQVTAYLTENLPRIIEETDVWQIVYDTIMGYDERKLEALTREIANRELRGVTLWGGVIGAFVGLSMSLVMWCLG
ncbi:MAG: DUF445 domain-containing protein [Kiritimatiellia bacterium]